MTAGFQEKALKLTKKIPKGKISTYKEIAIALGKPGASRAVGNALNKNEKPVKIPCHRVIKSNGFIGGYSLGVKKKKKLLEKEGLQLKGLKIKDFEKALIKANNLKKL